MCFVDVGKLGSEQAVLIAAVTDQQLDVSGRAIGERSPRRRGKNVTVDHRSERCGGVGHRAHRSKCCRRVPVTVRLAATMSSGATSARSATLEIRPSSPQISAEISAARSIVKYVSGMLCRIARRADRGEPGCPVLR